MSVEAGTLCSHNSTEDAYVYTDTTKIDYDLSCYFVKIDFMLASFPPTSGNGAGSNETRTGQGQAGNRRLVLGSGPGGSEHRCGNQLGHQCLQLEGRKQEEN